MNTITFISGALLLLIGLWGIISKRNIIRMIIAFSLLDTGLHVLIVTLGSIKGRTAPILDTKTLVDEGVKHVVDPVPQALVLTAIVIGLAVTALMLAYALKLHQKRGSLNIDRYEDLKW